MKGKEREREREREREYLSFLCRKNIDWIEEKITNFYDK